MSLTNTNKVTKAEQLLRTVKARKSMTYKQIVEFLTGFPFDRTVDRGAYSSMLYGSRTRTGLVGTFLKRGKNGKYTLANPKKKIQGPFTTTRTPKAPSVDLGV